MSSFEGIHDNLLQGVSQQVPRSRLAGQLTLQENMLSDPVTGLRRRAGSVVTQAWVDTQATSSSIVAWRTDIGGVSCSCVVDTVGGSITLIEEGKEPVKLTNAYLKAASPSLIRYASVGESLFIANLSKIPRGQGNVGGANPKRVGYFYIKATALSKSYSVTIKHTGGTFTGSYTTPDGTHPDHIAQTTPEYIAQQVLNSLNAQTSTVDWAIDGSYIFFALKAEYDNLSVTSNSGSVYVGTSNSSIIRDYTDLPPRLPNEANGMIIATGTAPNYVYFRYNADTVQWLQSAAYGSVGEIVDTPVEVHWDAVTSNWVIDANPWRGRLSGDDESNPVPDFVDWGITGIGSYQGRLVILSGSWVWLSATNKPRQFFRSTVEEVLDTDPIGIGSSAATSAAFQYAIPFNKDLILFSREFQALIAGGNQAITPRNASMVVTSTYSADMTCPPVTLGRSIMYPIPRSQNFFGVLEMLPSPYTDSQYISSDATEHIPRYMAGRCRFAVSSSVSSIVLFGSTTDTRALYVHEYMWDGEDKVLRAWHRWSFEYPVAYAYFNGDLINIITVNNGVVVICTIDPRSGLDQESGDIIGYMDYVQRHPVDRTSGTPKVTPSATMIRFYRNGADLSKVKVGYAGGGLDGYEIGSSRNGNTLELNKSTTATHVFVGMPFVSRFAPSPPIMRGEDELPINTNKMTLVRYYITTEQTGQFLATVMDTATQTEAREWNVNPVTYTSQELSLGKTPVNGEIGNVIPCRVNASTGVVVFTVYGLTDFNVLSLEYVCRYNQRLRRR